MNINSEEIINLYKSGISIRGICRKLNISEGRKTYISNLLSKNNIKIRKGKIGIKIGSVINERCPSCKKVKQVKLRKLDHKPRLCVSCAIKKSHKDNPRIKRGENHYNWKGGININKQGYIIEYVRPGNPYYPMAANTGGKRFGGYILQHRLIMAKHLKRCLRSDEIVHHKNGNKQDNKIENLAIYTRLKHKNSYQDGYRAGYHQAILDSKKWGMEKSG